jgi:hypothetical protein
MIGQKPWFAPDEPFPPGSYIVAVDGVAVRIVKSYNQACEYAAAERVNGRTASVILLPDALVAATVLN